jgi:polyphosphate glucokinase
MANDLQTTPQPAAPPSPFPAAFRPQSMNGNALDKANEKSPHDASIIGIDIGGTGIKGGIVDLKEGKLLSDPFYVATPQPATVAAITDAVELVVTELTKRPEAPSPGSVIGITYPGIIRHGVAHSAANLDKDWLNTDIDALFTERLGRPVEVINDADAAGLAEARYGAGAGIAGTVIVITLGTGIGSAFVFDGKLVPNTELGHLEIDGSPAESKASAVARERTGLSWQEYSLLLQRYFSHVEFLFSPELFIVGGGISERAYEYLPNLNLRTPIVAAALTNEAGIVGAAADIAMKHKLAI